MRKITSVVLFSFAMFSAALAQSGSPVKQSGNVTPGSVPWWITSGVISGGVSSVDSPITSFGVTNNGPSGICANSARPTAAGYNRVCMGAQTDGPAQITLQNFGTAAPQVLQFCINGACISFGETTLTKTTNYTIASTDCGKTIQAGTGTTGKFTITLPSVTGFSTTCTVTVLNGDTGRGKILSEFPSDVFRILFPAQVVKVSIINGAWATTLNPGRWRLPGPTILYLDNAGSDTANDGLAAGDTGAFQTFNGMVATILNNVDLNSNVLLMQNATGQNLADLQITGDPVGTGTIVLDGGTSTVNGASSSALRVQLGLFGGVASNLQLQNMTITCAAGKSGIDVESGYVTLAGGAGGNITFGTCGAAHLLADGAGARIFNPVGNNYMISGGAGYHLLQLAGGLIDFNGGTVTLTGTPVFGTAFAEADYAGPCMISQATWSGPATGIRSAVNNFGCIANFGSAFPGSIAGVVDNGAYTGGLSLTKTNPNIVAQSTTNGTTNAAALQAANSNSSSLPGIIANEPGRTTVRYGVAIGGYGEFVDFGAGGNGAFFGVFANKPAIFVNNNTESARFSGSGGFSIGTTADPGIGTLMLKKQAFSALTACSSTIEGAMASVTDSSTNTWGATITGSSTNHVLAYCDGTNWTVAGK